MPWTPPSLHQHMQVFLCADISSLQLFPPEFFCFCLGSKVEVPALPDEDSFPHLIQSLYWSRFCCARGSWLKGGGQEWGIQIPPDAKVTSDPAMRAGKEEKYLLAAAREGSLPALPKAPAVHSSAARAASPTGLQAVVHTRQSKQGCDFRWI